MSDGCVAKFPTPRPRTPKFHWILWTALSVLLAAFLVAAMTAYNPHLHIKAGVGKRPPWRMQGNGWLEWQHFVWDGPTGTSTSGRTMMLRTGHISFWLELIDGDDIER